MRINPRTTAGRFIKSGIAAFCFVVLFAGCGAKTGSDSGASQASVPATTSASPSPSVNASASIAGTNASISSASSPGSTNACDLIDKSDIAAVQGAQVQSTIPNTQTSGAIVTSQCYYTVTSRDGSHNLSVHLQVMRADLKDPKAISEYWKNAFHKKSEGEREKKEGPPKSVAGIGEEAFWIDSGKTGVLYALKKNSLVRVSIGGPDSKNRLEKSKTLMAKALGRLS
jgi:hypothetical protein